MYPSPEVCEALALAEYWLLEPIEEASARHLSFLLAGRAAWLRRGVSSRRPAASFVAALRQRVKVSFAGSRVCLKERFDTPGEYEHYCLPHPWMRAKVIVEAG